VKGHKNGFSVVKVLVEDNYDFLKRKDAADHFRANPNSLYYKSMNKRKVEVVVNCSGYNGQSKTVEKDAGGAETAD
jgi:hypothetical protein